ncbi:MAG: CinA family protein [Proteobacteria bacterium]|nr:CinA family protein [Pseudomonadota bacterium]
MIPRLRFLTARNPRIGRDALAREVLAEARRSGVMIVTAESCTGGLVAAALTEIAGSSDVFDRGFVTYSNAAKIRQLGVDPRLIAEHGAVSEPVAVSMAGGALANSDAHLAVSVTGIAGPGGGTADKPVGLVCFGVARRGGEAIAATQRFGQRGRGLIRAEATLHALRLLREG